MLLIIVYLGQFGNTKPSLEFDCVRLNQHEPRKRPSCEFWSENAWCISVKTVFCVAPNISSMICSPVRTSAGLPASFENSREYNAINRY